MKISKQKLAAIIILFLIVGLYLFLRFSPYPAFEIFKQQNYSTSIYDCNGQLVQVLPVDDGLRREWTPLKKIPSEVKKIFINAEDKRFYFHWGVDYGAIAKAALQNAKAKRIVRGGSTITMQLVKIISPSAGSRTFSKKLSDIFNAYRLEARLTKNQILELYLNSVPFGMNCAGVTSAARSFYGTELSKLSTDQVKCLSVIPRRPVAYNPIQNPKACADCAGVPLEAAASAYLYEYPFYMPHYVNYLKKQAIDKNGKLPHTLKLKANLQLQHYAEKYLRTALEQSYSSRISNGAVLVIDNSDCSVLAWIGNGNWYDSQNGGQLDGVLINNQPGSSMKPFLYALGIETTDTDGTPEYYPSKIMADIPTEFGSSKLYIPANFNNRFNGPVRLRVALASSLNIPAVSLLNDIGVNQYLDFLYDLGFDSLRENGKQADLGLSLGAGEVNLAELVPAFSMFVRDGKYLPLEYSGKSEKQIISSDTARIICSILSDKDSRALGFGYTQTFQTDYPSIFKTGTANQYQNIVALGATKRYTVGVWMGNFSGETVVGKTGSSLPAWVAKNVLDNLEKNTPARDNTGFEEPEHWKKIRICSLSGMPASQDCPATVYDYVKDGMKLKQCQWHQRKGDEILIRYPPEYQTWILDNKISAQINYNSAPLKILTPQDNAIFYYSNLNSDFQAIPVQVSGGYENTLYVIYDETEYAALSRPFTFSLPVEKGQHTVHFTCGSETAAITYQVK